MTLREMDEAGHEHVAFYRDESTGLRCIVAVYDSRRGPAVGGTRMLDYDDEADALEDALRLSEAMAYKTAAAELPLGGGKAVIVGDPDEKTDDLLRAYGRVVDSYDGRFVTGEDVNIDVADLRVIQETTGNVGGAGGGEGTDVTAAGVVHGLRACFAERGGDDSLDGRRIAVQGVGKVGRALVERLVDEWANVVVADVDEEAVAAVEEEFDVESVAPEAIYDEPCDAFAPCALGGVLNDETISRLECDIVCGSANNQLAARRHADALAERGILYAPDYVVNAGGLVAGVTEMEGGDTAEALERVAAVRDRLESIFETARAEGITPLAAADRFAEARMAEGGESTLF
ncbi:Glu/Leu/Phe/Val dehydrogenase family protein [Haloglomus salinum]|uniref:Glu/Leu/Phe/Val dehydrogenase family protein n=1 Tax=Haloglomus salinum TaxID=2962673 RepID=UPI0020C9EBCD|nr:Glu/Leu/Phe/Val dehydrogenase family protein [Haloglomus salinum]